jgi:hypothetical protein
MNSNKTSTTLLPTEAFVTGRKPKGYVRLIHNTERRISFVLRPKGGHVPSNLPGIAVVRRRKDLARAASECNDSPQRSGSSNQRPVQPLTRRPLPRAASSPLVGTPPPARPSFRSSFGPFIAGNTKSLHSWSGSNDGSGDSSLDIIPSQVVDPDQEWSDPEDDEDNFATPPTQRVEDEVEDDEPPTEPNDAPVDEFDSQTDPITCSIHWEAVVATPPKRNKPASKLFVPLNLMPVRRKTK